MGFPTKDISKTGSNVEATSFSPDHQFLRKENDSKISKCWEWNHEQPLSGKLHSFQNKMGAGRIAENFA